MTVERGVVVNQANTVVAGAEENLQQRHDIDDMAEVTRFNNQELDLLKILHYGTSSKGLIKTFRELRTKLSKKARNKNKMGTHIPSLRPLSALSP